MLPETYATGPPQQYYLFKTEEEKPTHPNTKPVFFSQYSFSFTYSYSMSEIFFLI